MAAVVGSGVFGHALPPLGPKEPYHLSSALLLEFPGSSRGTALEQGVEPTTVAMDPVVVMIHHGSVAMDSVNCSQLMVDNPIILS